MSKNNYEKKIKRRKKILLNMEALQKMTHEELIDKIQQLEAHNLQLKNILNKQNSESALLNDKLSKHNKKFNFEAMPQRHVFLKFFYLGWNYQGYVTQEDTNNTVEYYLFKALEKCCLIENREKSNYHRCGRTDKGVSAFSQVISIDLRSKLSEPSAENVGEEYPYCSMLNRILPDNIRCYSWSHVGSSVSSRFDCSERTYKYYFPKGNLNLEAMLKGAKFLIGTHDFRNLCKMDVGNGVTEFTREVHHVDIEECFSAKDVNSGYKMFVLIIQGKSFLWHQIRCIMSVLLLIGQEKESPDIISHLLNIKNYPAKPQYSLANHLPLNLYHVRYHDVAIQWNTDPMDLSKTIQLLQSHWTEYSVKSTMIRDMIEELQKLGNKPINIENQAESLLEGVKSKVYKPLLMRMKCESLENKISQCIKKRKLEIVETTENRQANIQK